MKLKSLHERLSKVAQEMRTMADTLCDTKPDFTAEEKPNWDKLNAEANSLESQIAIEQRAVKVIERADAKHIWPDRENVGREDVTPEESRASAGTPQATEEDRAYALQGWILAQRGDDISDRHKQAMQRCGVRANQSDFCMSNANTFQVKHIQEDVRLGRFSREQRAQSAVSASTGGTFIDPGTMASSIEAAMLYYGPMLAVSDIMRTNSGEPLVWPSFNDTSNTGTQIGENTDVSVTNITTAATTWSAYKFSSNELLVPYELLQDSPFNLATLFSDALGERLGRIMNTKFTTGTGASTPYGIVNRATTGKTAASATAIAADELIDLQHSVDVSYRSLPSVAWMMHDLILAALRKLKDGNGQYLWQVGIAPGIPSTLLGSPIRINNDMQSSIATATTTILYGALDKYKVRMVGGPRFYRLTERRRETDQDAFIAFVRCDGNLLNAGGNPVKALVQA